MAQVMHTETTKKRLAYIRTVFLESSCADIDRKAVKLVIFLSL